MSAVKRRARAAVAASLIVLLLLAFPAALLLTGFLSPSQFYLTYYAELADMYSKLRGAEGKKIVVIGTSSVAFGVDSALIEEQLRAAGADYEVCNFGLYGALGTKVMLDLSRDSIGEGDIVIFAPELSEQTLSLYFSASEMWRAADCDYSLFFGIAKENLSAMTGNFTSYVAEKTACVRSGSPASPSGVYAHSSFDGNCDMKNAERGYNIMLGGYDVTNMLELDADMFSEQFVDYVNDYNDYITSRGAVMYFSFPPINASCLKSYDEEDVEKFWSALSKLFDCKIISDVNDYIMDEEWFFDTNFHVNSSGMTVHSVSLLNDIKNELGLSYPTSVVLPEKPSAPSGGESHVGDNSFENYFEYAVDSDGNTYISGITEAGRSLSDVVVPYSHGGEEIKYFSADTFSGNASLRSVTLQPNIALVYDGSFSGCTSLQSVIVEHGDPASLQVGYGLLDGTDADICVDEGAYAQFIMNYTWGWYADRIVGVSPA